MNDYSLYHLIISRLSCIRWKCIKEVFSPEVVAHYSNERDGVSNYRRLDCLPKRLFRRKSKKTSKLRVTGLCKGNPPVAGGFLSQRDSNAENASIWWRHHVRNICVHTSSSEISLLHSNAELPRCYYGCPNKLLNKQPSDRWFETSWRICDADLMLAAILLLILQFLKKHFRV